MIAVQNKLYLADLDEQMGQYPGWYSRGMVNVLLRWVDDTGTPESGNFWTLVADPFGRDKDQMWDDAWVDHAYVSNIRPAAVFAYTQELCDELLRSASAGDSADYPEIAKLWGQVGDQVAESQALEPPEFSVVDCHGSMYVRKGGTWYRVEGGIPVVADWSALAADAVILTVGTGDK